MPRTAVALAMILTLVTGLMTGLLAAQRSWSPPPIAPADARAIGTAHDFYASVNRFLQTGDALPLSALLGPDFVDHPAYREGDQPASAYIAYLESVRTTFPGLQLNSVPLSANGGMVAVDISVAGQTAGSFAGITLDAGGIGRGYEVIRVEGDRVVERWGSRELPPLTETIATVLVPVETRMLPDPRIDRLSFEPNGVLELSDRNGFLFVVESGELAFDVLALPEEPAVDSLRAVATGPLSPRGGIVRLVASESISIPAGSQVRLMNVSGAAATALVVSIRPKELASGPVPYSITEVTAVERTSLGGGVPVEIHNRGAVFSITVGRAELAAGASLARHQVGVEELLVVAEGAVEVLVHDGALTWVRSGKSYVTVTDRQMISAGQVAAVHPGSIVEYRVAGHAPAAFWIVRIDLDPVIRSALIRG